MKECTWSQQGFVESGLNVGSLLSLLLLSGESDTAMSMTEKMQSAECSSLNPKPTTFFHLQSDQPLSLVITLLTDANATLC